MRGAGLILAALAASAAAATPSLAERLRGTFFGALTSDAMTLGSHYEYDAIKIKQAYGGKTIDRYMSPGQNMGGMTHGVGWGARNYHEGNYAGDTTDYGDYCTLVLNYMSTPKVLKTLSQGGTSSNARMDLSDFARYWRKQMETQWNDWMCTMTRQTLQNLQRGVAPKDAGGISNAMAIRFPALYAVYDDEEALVEAAVSVTTGLTHKNSDTLETSEFFARVTYRVIHNGAEPRAAIEEVAAASPSFIQQKVKQALAKVEEAADPNSDLAKDEFTDDKALTSMARLWEVGKSEPIKVGKASPCEGTLPGAVYFIVKYAGQFENAVAANAMVGGDSAARSIPIGMVMGAALGDSVIPQRWKDDLKGYNKLSAKLGKMPLFNSGDDL